VAELPFLVSHSREGFFLSAMQKIYNLLGVLSFVMSGTMAVMGVVAYTRVPSMVKNYTSELKLELTKTILDQIPVPEIPKMPQLPSQTGPAIPSIN
jgi:hypothetical protein|tara:strand:- start:340 stop:627 length:288 start_codon:yes stop_codon:yes gene_type:complete